MVVELLRSGHGDSKWVMDWYTRWFRLCFATKSCILFYHWSRYCMTWAPAVEDGIHVFSYPSNGTSLLSIMSDVPLTLEMVLIEAYIDWNSSIFHNGNKFIFRHATIFLGIKFKSDTVHFFTVNRWVFMLFCMFFACLFHQFHLQFEA